MKLHLLPFAGSVTAALFLAAPAMAHPKLVSASPAPNATVASPKQLRLTYSEKLVAPMSGVALTMIGMPGMANHPPMKISGFKTSVAPDGKTLVVSLAKPLAGGTYQLKWHAVAADTHRITGDFVFKVK